jgi:hypothetical protein
LKLTGSGVFEICTEPLTGTDEFETVTGTDEFETVTGSDEFAICTGLDTCTGTALVLVTFTETVSFTFVTSTDPLDPFPQANRFANSVIDSRQTKPILARNIKRAS